MILTNFNFNRMTKMVTRMMFKEDQDPSGASIDHVVLVIDASGSMYYELDKIKSFLIKLLVLEEYRRATTLVTILSYSSKGDVQYHVKRAAISSFLDMTGPGVASIQKMQVRGMTCISQGLNIKDVLKDGETTGVILLSDGYANDPSPGTERRSIDSAMLSLMAQASVFVNTIAFGNYADFALLSHIANVGSGRCFRTPSAKDVYDAIHETCSLITASVAKPVLVDVPRGSLGVAVSTSARKVIAGTEPFFVRGMKKEDDVEVTIFSDGSDVGGNERRDYYILARACLAVGKINEAKVALLSSKNQTILNLHGKAIVPEDIKALSDYLEGLIFDGDTACEISEDVILPGGNLISVWEVAQLLNSIAEHVMVDVDATMVGYKRRGVKNIPGKRAEDGSIIPVRTTSEILGDPRWAKFCGIELNNSSANMNMLLSQRLRVRDENGKDVSEVVGLDLDLKSYRNYTVVGDGSVMISSIHVRLDDMRAFKTLQKAGLVRSDITFDLKATYEIDLQWRPVIGWASKFDAKVLDGVFDKILRLKCVKSILDAMTKKSSTRFTPEQSALLKDYYITDSLYYSPPSTVPWTDKAKAIADGIVDTRVAYSVDFGTTEVFNLSEIKSANAGLQARFEATTSGQKIEKPTWDMWATMITTKKTPSARTKIGPADEVQILIMDDFLGHGDGSQLKKVLGEDLGGRLWTAIKNGLSQGPRISKEIMEGKPALLSDDVAETLVEAKKAAEAEMEALYDGIRPMVLYIGSTGMVPDDLKAEIVSAEDLGKVNPNLKIPASVKKNPDEIQMFRSGNNIIQVEVQSVDFTP